MKLHKVTVTTFLGRVPESSDASLPSQKSGNVPTFLWHFSEARPLFVFISRNSESRPRAAMTLATKIPAPVKRFSSLYLYHVGHFNVDFKCSYTLDYIATLFQSPVYALHGLAVRAIQCKVVMFGFGLVC